MDQWFGDADRQYIRENYRKLSELTLQKSYAMDQVHQAIEVGNLPRPPYILNGEAWVPADYFSLWEDAIAQGVPVHQVFRWRYYRARQMMDAETPENQELDDVWRDYLGGDYGICLWKVTPENIVRKSHLILEIRALLRSPRPGEQKWQERLRQSVENLDRLERPFAEGDRLRFGAVSSRILYVDAPKAYFPEAFEAQ